MDTNLEKYLRQSKHRVFRGKSAREDLQCACWLNSPMDVKSDHPGNELYKYRTLHWDKYGLPHKEEGSEVWLCRACYKTMKQLEAFLLRDGRAGVSVMPEIVLGEPQIYPASATSHLGDTEADKAP